MIPIFANATRVRTQSKGYSERIARSFSALVVCLLIAWVMHPVNVSGQCNGFSMFQPALFPLTSYDGAALKAVDVNGDGAVDLIAAITETGKVSVQLGNGEGGIISSTDFPANLKPTDLELADFDRDGELDIVVTNTLLHQLSFLRGNGQGSFTLTGTLPISFSPSVVEVGNFDSDEFLDIAVGLSNTLKIFRGAGDFAFTEAASIPTSFAARVLEGGDFNGDGKKDLVIGTFDGNGREVRVYLGQGNNTFQISATFPSVYVSSVGVMDFDNDQKLDLVISDIQTSRYSAHRGNGDGSFQPAVITNFNSTQSLKSMDYDRDGHLDLITTSAVLRGDGTGAFTLFTLFGIPSVGASSVALADFNSDALLDFLIITSRVSPNDVTSVILNNNGAPIPARIPFNTGSRGYEIESSDLNLDGRADLVAIDAGSNRALVFLQSTVGEMIATPPSGILLTSGFNVGPYGLTVADLNSDTKPDFVVPDSFARKVNVFTGVGDGTFVRSIIDIPPNTSVPSFVRTGDFNNDTKPDIIALSGDSRNFYILLNDGNGGFTVVTPAQTNGSQSGPNKVAVGDFTNDGKADLVVARFFDPGMVFFYGLGTGVFEASPFFVNGSANITAVQAGDYDNDGFLDLAFTGGEGFAGSFKITFGVGNGGFFNTQTFPINGSAHDVEYADFDLDGISDFIVASASIQSIVFYKGRGNRVFDPGVTRYVGSSPAAMTSNDFNNDGKRDLAFVTRGIGSGYIVMNTTNLLPCASVNDVQVTEGNSGTVTATLEVTLSATSTETVTIDYKTVGRTASAGSDFLPTMGTLSFPPGVVSQTVNVTVNADVLDEDNETIALTLGPPNHAAISDGVGVITVTDDDAPPHLIIGNASIVEGSGGNTAAAVPISLSGASGRKIKFRIQTQDVTATAGQDYVALIESTYFNPGETSRNFTVIINPDYRVEPDETISLNADNITNSDPPAGPGTITILNDDVGGSVQFSTETYEVAESGGSAIVTITRTNGNASDIVVNYSTADGTAMAGEDYTAVSGMVTFGANENTKTFAIPIINDSRDEASPETVNLSITNITGGASPGTPTAAILNIQDDDAARSFDFDGDGKTDIGIFRPSVGEWWYQRSSDGQVPAFQFGASTDRIVPGDYTGDGKTDIAFFRPSTGEWYILRSENLSFYSFPFGASEDIPAPADYDADGKADPAVFRPSTATWYIQRSSDNGTTIAQFGATGDYPVAADYDGDGKADLAIYRPSNGQWWLNRSTAGVIVHQFGNDTDKAVQGDYTGDGKSDVAFWRPSTGEWYILRSEDNSYYSAPFGTATDIPAPGDYDGDGKFDTTVFRPSSATWFSQRTTAGTLIQQFGATGDTPIPNAFVP